MLGENLIELVESGVPTTFIDIDQISSKPASIVITTILKLRKRELEKVTDYILNEHAYLDALGMTAYGFRVLKALGMKRYANVEGLQKIEQSIIELGHILHKNEVDNSEE